MIVYLEYSYVGVEVKRNYSNFNIVDKKYNTEHYIRDMKWNGYHYEITIDGVYKYWIDMDFCDKPGVINKLYTHSGSKFHKEVNEYIRMNLRRLKMERLL